MRRRQLLKAMSQATVLASLPVSIVNAQSSSEFRFGLQLSTLNSLMREDFFTPLQEVSDIGFRLVEFSAGGFLGRDPEQVKSHLAQNNLVAPVGRVSPDLPSNYSSLSREEQREVAFSLRGADSILRNVESALKLTVDMNQRYLNIPFLPASDFTSREQVENIARLFNEAGELCKKQGVLLGYHNHDWEFHKVDGILPYDLLLAETDPELMSFQLDTYWVTKGGANIIEYIERHPGRFSSCHLKDIDAHGNFEDVGYGEINFPEFINAAMENGSEYFFVERDGPPEPMNSIRRSYTYLSGLEL